MLEAGLNFGFMAREGVLKENIDGEALLWAHSRLEKLDSKNKVLIVLCDGAPVDDSTLSVNSERYLQNHLEFVISNLEEKASVTLFGIGIDHPLIQIYKNSLMVKEEQSIEEAIIACLEVVSISSD
jgi:cobaltochelatase CobT